MLKVNIEIKREGKPLELTHIAKFSHYWAVLKLVIRIDNKFNEFVTEQRI